MKIAIQGNLKRGKEVIRILESLGGINRYSLSGTCLTSFYYINKNNNIKDAFGESLCNYTLYTLEEFEKEFPFKVGDKVRDRSDDEIGTILGFIDLSAFIDVCNELMYVVDFEKSGHANMPVEKLKPYKEMKEERNITLTLEKAKEWYKKGGELREIALQAFSERELNSFPRSWEEFCRDNPVKTSEAVICTESTIVTCDCSEIRDSDCDREICPSIKSAEAHLAMIQLEQLRNCWWNGWEPDWNDDKQTKYCIVYYKGEFKISILCETRHFLSFPTMKMAEEFLKCFKDLIEKAGDLI